MTRAQLTVLVMLGESPREMTKNTHGRWVSGCVAKALIRQGLARRQSRPYYGGAGWMGIGPELVEITEKGRAALASVKVSP